MMTNELLLLTRFGDPLEKAIAADHQEMKAVMYVYASVWAEQVLSRRTEDHLRIVDPAWRAFAAHHYTALIRVNHALQDLREIKTAVRELVKTPRDGSLLLQLHRELAAFWENLGSAIDNLERAYCAAPGAGKVPARTSELAFAYNRRTQFIHSRLVPVSTEDGSIEFNLVMFNDETTNWDQEQHKPEWVDHYHEAQWRSVTNGLQALWGRLQQVILPSRPPSWSPDTWLEITNIPVVPPSGVYLP